MAALLKKGLECYKYFNEDIADPRLSDWPLMSSPWKVVVIIGLYLYFCLDAGPKLMKNRPALNVDRLIVVYDAFQIVVCGWLTIQGFHFIPGRYKFYCEPMDYSNDEYAVYVAKLGWLYGMLKLLDLLDTVFFVLRKKNSQITFLHVYHHALMALGVCVGMKYFAGGHFTLLAHVNSFVHAVMYSYYLLSNINPAYKKSAWWKKHITQLQIAQFLLLFIQYFPTLFWDDCAVNFPARVFLTLQNLFMVLLFCDFYRKAYLTKSAAK